MSEAAEAARHQYDNVLVTMHRNPLTSEAITAGVGLILALMLR
jgi:ElaB/YqjD/DUF883 family membrane-anchored ribosome-binding protein